MLKKHHANLKDINTFHADVKAFNAKVTKQFDPAEKAAKKTAPDKPTAALIKEMRSKTLPDLKKAQDILGSLKSFEVLYGTAYQKTLKAIAKTAVDAVTPKEFPDPLSDANRKKTDKELKSRQKDLKKFCADARALLNDKDLPAAQKVVDKAEDAFEVVNKFQKEALVAQKKMKKEIKENPNKKEIETLIRSIGKTFKLYVDVVGELINDCIDLKKELK